MNSNFQHWVSRWEHRHPVGWAVPQHLASRDAGAPSGRQQAFTLLEVLLAIGILAIVMVVVHSVFHAALQLRNRADAAFSEAIPLQHTLTLLKRDLANLTLPTGTLSGVLQTTPTNHNSLTHEGEQCGPSIYTASGMLTDNNPWSEMRKVTYYLVQPTNQSPGLDLVRSVTSNLLPVNEEEYTDQRLMHGVNALTFQFYDGSTWRDDWDSANTSTYTATNPLPAGVRVQLTLINDSGVIAREPVELVVPVAATLPVMAETSSGGGQ